MSKNFVKAEIVEGFNTAALGAGFIAVNANGFDHPLIQLRLNNTSNVDVFVSYDGTNAHEVVVAGADLTLNFQSNSAPNSSVAQLRQGTIVYVAQVTDAGAGYFYVGGYYLTS